MTREDRKYVRVYTTIIDDERFRDVYPNDAAIGTWLKLLLTADAVWPASCDLPRWVRPSNLNLLVDAGVVELLPAHRYRIHGLDNERSRRAASAAVGGLASGRSRSVEQPLNERSPSGGTKSNLAKQSKPEQTKDEQTTARADDDKDPADIYWQLVGRYPTQKTLAWIDDLVAKFGGPAVVRALVTAHIEDGSTQTLMGRAQDRLRAEARELDRREREAEQARLKEKRARPQRLEEWQVQYREWLEKEYAA